MAQFFKSKFGQQIFYNFMSVSYSGPLVDWWNMEHPGEPFPNPRQNPQMFQGLNLNIIENVYYGTPSCGNGMLCQYGIFDYQCQILNSCYLNLLQLFGTILLMLGIIYGIIWGIAFLCKHKEKLNIILNPLIQYLCCLKSFVNKLDCASFKKYFSNKNLKRKQKKTKQLKQQMKNMGLQVDVDALSVDKQKQLLQLVQQYKVISDDYEGNLFQKN